MFNPINQPIITCTGVRAFMSSIKTSKTFLSLIGTVLMKDESAWLSRVRIRLELGPVQNVKTLLLIGRYIQRIGGLTPHILCVRARFIFYIP